MGTSVVGERESYAMPIISDEEWSTEKTFLTNGLKGLFGVMS